MDNFNLLLAIIVLLFAWGNAEATGKAKPFQIQHQAPAFVERGNPFQLTFSAPGINPEEVQEAYVFYRHDGDMGYKQVPARFVSSEFKVKLSVESRQVSSMEYYFSVRLKNGDTATYPASKASQDPIRVEVVDPHKSERQQRVEATGVDYTILSPEPGTTVGKQDVVVAITLFYDPAEIDTANSSFRMMMDGEDVTGRANASDYFYTYSPNSLSGGTHKAKLKIQKPDTSITIVDWKFSVLDPNEKTAATGSEEESMPRGNVEISARNQRVGGYANDALSANVRLSGQKGAISYSAFGLLTTQEDPRLQPQNRYGASLYVGDWLELQAGHVYPRMNPLTIAGQRMQGIDASFHVWDEALNLQLVYGKLRRGIDNVYEEIQVEEQTLQSTQQTITNYSLDTSDNGTFRRKVMGGRIGIGGSEAFKLGLNFLKVEDDTNSIRVINNFNSLMSENPDLANSLSAQQQQDLQQNPQKLSVSGNPAPKGNFVAASDIETNLDNNRINFEADAAVSLLNQDISEGTLSQETAENLGLSLDENTESLLDRLSWLIIINENMDTLPIRFNTGTDGAETYFPTSILAAQSELGLSYFNNNLRVRYRWVGPNYNSLANTTIRKDIAGFTISDRIRLLDNRIYLTLGYERLQDNVINNKDATTNTTTYRTNVSWYPIEEGLPRVSIGGMKRIRDNGIVPNNPLVASINGVEEGAAVQNLILQQSDTLLTPNPRHSDTYQVTASVSQQFQLFGINHDASVYFSMLNTIDETFKYGDAQSNSFTARIVNRYPEVPLQTNVSFNMNNTETSSGLTDIQIMGASIGGEAFLFDDKLTLDISLAVTSNYSETTPLNTDTNGTPELTFDDYYRMGDSSSVSESNSYIVGAGVRYSLNQNHAFDLDFRYTNVRSTRYTSRRLPNDHLLQARYIFNF